MKRTYKAVPSSIMAAKKDYYGYADPNLTFEEWKQLPPGSQWWTLFDVDNVDTMRKIFEDQYDDYDNLRYGLLGNSSLPSDLRSEIEQRVAQLEAERAAKETIHDTDEYTDAVEYDRDDNTTWPDPERFDMIYDDEDMEDIWSTYLSGPEDEVQKELQLFFEPSVQGGVGSMFIDDESGEDRFDTIEVDFSEWESKELDMAGASNSPEEYKQKFKAYVESLIY